MTGAAAALQEAAVAALRQVDGLGVFDGPPVQAAVPYALVEAMEADWGHKSGLGREVRLAVTIRDEGERPVRLRRLMAEAEAALAAIGGQADGWRIVTLHFLRSRAVKDGKGVWAGVVEHRARMLKE